MNRHEEDDTVFHQELLLVEVNALLESILGGNPYDDGKPFLESGFTHDTVKRAKDKVVSARKALMEFRRLRRRGGKS